MAPHSSTLAWKIPWMEEPGRLQSMGSAEAPGEENGQRSLVVHWVAKSRTQLSGFTFTFRGFPRFLHFFGWLLLLLLSHFSRVRLCATP